ncbi:MAG TPA: hypothetical protein VK805_14860 [Candidatus Baltobacteraceae bacterium]|jgi:hypothetical protein|nr:hypothetical protein [Candidatus Baltobacteraceae bacterium]
MKINCCLSLPLDEDEPIPAILQFVRILRSHAVDTESAEIDLHLIGMSARAKSTIEAFKPERTKGALFAKALEITEELTALQPARMKSLQFLLAAEGFRWRGSNPGTSARLALLDAKSFQRRKRFQLTALLAAESPMAEDAAIDKMIADIAKGTGIQFEKQASIVHVRANEPGRVTSEELLVTALVWEEIIEQIRETLSEKVSLEGIPHLMTTAQAHDFLFDPKKLGKSVRVNFSGIVRKWLKREFPDYKKTTDHSWEGESLCKEIDKGVMARLRIDKRARAFSKEFSISLGLGLTSPRYAASPGRPFDLPANLFQLFGLWPQPLQWTYFSESDLFEALSGASGLLNQVLPIFESQAKRIVQVSSRKLSDFPGPRALSAKDAYDVALVPAKKWMEDAALLRANSINIVGPYLRNIGFDLPTLDDQGRAAVGGGWRFSFYSRKKAVTLFVTIPFRGAITQTIMDSPGGRSWPSHADQILRDGWIDSVEALWLARAIIHEKSKVDPSAEVQLFELASHANVLATGIIQGPMRDGMFPMEPRWRISFSRTSDDGRSIAMVAVPAYGDAPPTIEVHDYDKRGRPKNISL